MSKPAASTTDVESCASGMIARSRARQDAVEKRAAELRGRAEAVSRELARRFGVKSVWLFGSLAWGGAHADSDIDLLVEGLAAADGSAAIRLAEEVGGAAVDLVRLEEAPASLVETARLEGVRLDVTE